MTVIFSLAAQLVMSLAVPVEVDYHPKYNRVGGVIETVWQRPRKEPKGVFFIAHGCQHQGTDIFSDVGADGWEFIACRSSNFGRCLGLPEEVRLRQAARVRGYVAMAVSGGSGRKSCWNFGLDVARVKKAVHYVLLQEGLDPESTPILASGASSGGGFMGRLAAPVAHGGLANLKCIVPQIMGIGGNPGGNVPTLFVHMPRDSYTAAAVHEDMIDLRAAGTRIAEITVEPVPVTTQFLSTCLPSAAAASAVEALRVDRFLDQKGFLKQDPRSRGWVSSTRRAMSKEIQDSLVPDESCLAELMNVAWAKHEFTSHFAEEMLDFCEGKGQYALSSSGLHSSHRAHVPDL